VADAQNILCVTTETNNHFENLRFNNIQIDVKKQGVRVWTGFLWLRMEDGCWSRGTWVLSDSL